MKFLIEQSFTDILKDISSTTQKAGQTLFGLDQRIFFLLFIVVIILIIWKVLLKK